MAAATPIWRVLYRFLFLALPCLFACNGEEQTARQGTVIESGPQPQAECSQARACPAGQRCVDGACHLIRCNPTCGADEICDGTLEPPSCRKADPCREVYCEPQEQDGQPVWTKCVADPTAGPDGYRCVPLCAVNARGDQVQCPPGHTCNPDSGFCDCGGRPCPGDVGAACEENQDCHAGSLPICFKQFQEGYCTLECRFSPCPPGSACINLTGQFLCFDLCSGPGMHEECRDASWPYLCANLHTDLGVDCRTENICLPRSAPPSTCEGDACQPAGSACDRNDDCQADLSCIGMPDGFCSRGCSREAPCPEGSPCVSDDYFGRMCAASCDIGRKDCRAGYTCIKDSQLGQGHCSPWRCNRDSHCLGSTSTTCDGEFLSRSPDGLCDPVIGQCHAVCRTDLDCGAPCADMSQPCHVCRNEWNQSVPCDNPGYRRCEAPSGRCYTPCEEDAVCGPYGVCDGSTRRCRPPCHSEAQCGEGLHCYPDGHCRPHCWTQQECKISEYCEISTGFCRARCREDTDCREQERCDRMARECVRELSQVAVGQHCRRDGECGTWGTCLHERTDGFPRGYCTALGCREAEPCPAATVCAQIGSDERLLTLCVRSCDPAVAEAARQCDPVGDYACLPLTMEPPAFGCLPATMQGSGTP